jgi:hypothetical protein
MRRIAAFLTNILALSVCSAQTSVPIPANPYELVTGNGKSAAKPMERTQALALLNKAKRPMRLLAPTTPPYLLTASFTAIGDPANTGSGELTQLWYSGQSNRWTARFGDFSVTRVHTGAGAFEEKHVPLVPMRIHMLRNAIFWAAQGITAASQFRTAAVEWNGRPATCLLVSEKPDALETPARRWDESEYCIDDQTQLLQILSIAPGSYTVYNYSAAQSFHGQPVPDRIKTYLGAIAVIDATLRIDEPSGAPPSITPEMIAAGPPVVLEEPIRRRMNIPNTWAPGAASPVIVNAQVGPDGKVAALELCAAADPSLAARVLDQVKGTSFGPSNTQRQTYLEVRFIPPAAKSLNPPTAAVPAEPYYIEQIVSMPGRSDVKEIRVRRSDGATLYMTWTGLAEHGQFVRNLRFPDGRSVAVYDSVKAKVTETALFVPRTSDCSAHGSLLRREQLEGQDVEMYQMTAGSHRIALWTAPQLGCEILQVKSEEMQQDGSFRPASATKTTLVVVGEPQSALFEIAPDMVEMKPSAAMRRLMESLDLGLNPEQKAAMLSDVERMNADADKHYLDKQNGRPKP